MRQRLEQQASPKRSVRRRLIPLALVGFFVVIYLVTIGLYANDLAGTELRSERLGDDGADFALVVKPRGLDPLKQELSFQLEVDEGSGLIDESGTGLTSPVRVEIRNAVEGSSTKTIEFGQESLSAEVLVHVLSIDRRLEAWPFDRYAADMTITVEREGADGDVAPIAADLLLDGGLPGWDISSDGGEQLGESSDGTFDTSILVSRSFSTLAFACVLVASMLLMAVIALSVSINVVRGERRMELIFLGWIAGMLFAVPALRSFLPGQPPIGSWVDFLIVLWVIVSLIISLALLVIAWFRSPKSQPERT